MRRSTPLLLLLLLLLQVPLLFGVNAGSPSHLLCPPLHIGSSD